MRSPSVDAAAHARPVGENRIHFVRASLLYRRLERSPRCTPGKLTSKRSSRSLSSPRSSIKSMLPASVTRLLSRNSSVPSSDKFSDICQRRMRTPSRASYSVTYLLLPPARTHDPSAFQVTLVNALLDALFDAATRSSALRPPEMSFLPSIIFVCFDRFVEKNVSCPSSVDTTSSWPSGRKESERTSALSWKGSTACDRLKTSHIRTVLSQDPLARTLTMGENASELTGPSCPVRTSNNFPV